MIPNYDVFPIRLCSNRCKARTALFLKVPLIAVAGILSSVTMKHIILISTTVQLRGVLTDASQIIAHGVGGRYHRLHFAWLLFFCERIARTRLGPGMWARNKIGRGVCFLTILIFFLCDLSLVSSSMWYTCGFQVRGFCKDLSNEYLFDSVNVRGDIRFSDLHHNYFGMWVHKHPLVSFLSLVKYSPKFAMPLK